MRITNEMRESILVDQVRKKFHDKISLVTNELKLECERQIAESCPKIPDELEEYIERRKNFSYPWLDSRSKRGLPSSCNNYYPIKRNEYEHTLKRTTKIDRRIKAFNKVAAEKNTFKSNLKSVLYSFTTDKKLLLVVPELSPYFVDQQKAESMSVVPIEQINTVRKSIVGAV